MKRIAVIALCLLLLVGAWGCAKKPGDTVIATINGKDLYQRDFEAPFLTYLNQYSQAGYDMTNADNLKALQDSVFNTLVRSEVIYQQAAAQNLTLTEEEKAAIVKDASAQYDALLSAYVQQAQLNNESDPEKAGKQKFIEELKVQGYTEKTLREQIEHDMQKSSLTAKLEESVTSKVTFTEEEAKTRYETELSEQRTAFSATPAAYENAQSAYESGSGAPPLYVPEGFVRVKHILVNDEATANDLIKRLDEGEDFDALMAEFGTDPGMKAEPSKTHGYLMGKDTSFVQEFKEAGLALANVGEHTAPVKSQFGYHIIKLVSRVESGDQPFDAVKADYISRSLLTLKQEAYSAEVERWTQEADVTSYIGRIRSLGAATPAP